MRTTGTWANCAALVIACCLAGFTLGACGDGDDEPVEPSGPTSAEKGQIAGSFSFLVSYCLDPKNEAKAGEELTTLIDLYHKYPGAKFKLTPGAPVITVRKILTDLRSGLGVCAPDLESRIERAIL